MINPMPDTPEASISNIIRATAVKVMPRDDLPNDLTRFLNDEPQVRQILANNLPANGAPINAPQYITDFCAAIKFMYTLPADLGNAETCFNRVVEYAVWHMPDFGGTPEQELQAEELVNLANVALSHLDAI